jgi:hypothetical protein
LLEARARIALVGGQIKRPGAGAPEDPLVKAKPNGYTVSVCPIGPTTTQPKRQ